MLFSIPVMVGKKLKGFTSALISDKILYKYVKDDDRVEYLV